MNGDNLGLVERDSTSRRHYLLPRLASWMLVALSCMSCATVRTTDPNRTATEQFLVSAAATRAVDQLTPTTLRDRRVFIDSSYLFAGVASNDQSFLLGELRAKLLTNGVRLVKNREEAQIVLEVRAGALSVDRIEYLLGIPATYLTGSTTGTPSNVPIVTPELAIVKDTKQQGYASVAFIAYWNDTGELIASSGPFVGKTLREDFWFFGLGPRTVGNIPPAEK
jgi:hypothetical protein